MRTTPSRDRRPASERGASSARGDVRLLTNGSPRPVGRSGRGPPERPRSGISFSNRFSSRCPHNATDPPRPLVRAQRDRQHDFHADQGGCTRALIESTAFARLRGGIFGRRKSLFPRILKMNTPPERLPIASSEKAQPTKTSPPENRLFSCNEDSGDSADYWARYSDPDPNSISGLI